MGLYAGSDHWEDNIHYVEIGDPGEGGFNGISNVARIQLANRTTYLKQRVSEHTVRTDNPHATTKTQLGLSNVTNDIQLKLAQNLADLLDKSVARANLGVYASSAVDTLISALLRKDSNLSDLANASTARSNLGTYSQSEIDTKDAAKLAKASNLSDLSNKSTSRSNLDVYSKSEIAYYLGLKAEKNHTHTDIIEQVIDISHATYPGVVPGYIKFDDGVIIQWNMVGTDVTSADTGYRAYGWAFPSNSYVVVGNKTTGDKDTTITFTCAGREGFYIRNEGTTQIPVYYIAIGR